MSLKNLLSSWKLVNETLLQVGDDVSIGPNSTFDSLDDFETSTVDEIENEDVFELQCTRNEWAYSIIGTPNHNFIEVVFEYDVQSSVLLDEISDDSIPPQELTKEEFNSQLQQTTLQPNMLKQKLTNARQEDIKDIITELNEEIGTQTQCNYTFNTNQNGDIIQAQVSQKLFVKNLTKPDIEEAVVAVTNTGRKMVSILSRKYNLAM